MTTSGTWIRGHGLGNFLNTFTSSTHAGDALTKAGVAPQKEALVVQTCPTCGSVTVTFGGEAVATVSLHSAQTKHEVVLALPAFHADAPGTLIVKVVGSGHKVVIDGLGVSRAA